jgi:acyl-CoA hydrolase
MHGKIFGGYLMKEAYEIGWLAAYMYAGSTISLIHIDDF